MSLEVTLDRRKLVNGDTLLVTMQDVLQQVTICPIRRGFNQRWCYADYSWIPDDAQRIKELEARFLNPHDRDMSQGHLWAYIRRLEPGSTLSCDLFMSWSIDGKQRPIEEYLGNFESCGGLVTNVEALPPQ